MASVFGLSSDGDGRQRKTQVTYGKLSRPSGKLARPQTKIQDSSQLEPSRAPLKTTNTTKNGISSLPKTHKRLQNSAHDQQHSADCDEWDIPSDEETPRPRKVIKTATSSRKSSVGTTPSPRQPGRRPSQALDVKSPSGKRKRDVVIAAAQAQGGLPRLGARSLREVNKRSVGPKVSPIRGLQNGKSAPARLADMVEETSLSTLDGLPESPPQVSHTNMSNNLQTPPRQRSQPPTLKKAASLTPKQNRLWTQLLDADDTDVRAMRSTKDTKLQFGGPLVPNSLEPQPVSPAPSTSRQRLADKLKQDSQLTLDDSTDEEDLSDDLAAATAPSQQTPKDISVPSKVVESAAAKHTYSQSRSFLKESFEDSLSQPLITDVPDLKAKFQSEMDLELEDEAPTNLRTVHELRAAGSRKRFVDDLEALSDDMKDRSRAAWSRRRSALMELSFKLFGSDYAVRFAESSYALTLVKELSPQDPTDRLADTILFVIVSTLAYQDLPVHLVDDMRAPPVISWLMDAVGKDTKVTALARDRANNMSKMSQESYLDYMETVRLALLWEGATPKVVGTEVLALKALQGILLKTRKTGQRHTVLTDRHVDKIIKLVHLTSPQDTDCVLKQQLALSILEGESVSMTMLGRSTSSLWTSSTVVNLLGPFTEVLAVKDEDGTSLASYLRLLLNITNNQPTNCAVFATTHSAAADLFRYISAGFSSMDVSDAHLDLLLLSLGLAINLAEHSDAVRKCIPPQVLSSLTQTFVRGEEASSQAASLEQSRANVAYGYLAILLANASLNEAVKTTVKNHLPNGDVGIVVRSVEEFLGYHRRVDEGDMDEETRDEAWAGFTERLGAVVEKLRQ